MQSWKRTRVAEVLAGVVALGAGCAGGDAGSPWSGLPGGSSGGGSSGSGAPAGGGDGGSENVGSGEDSGNGGASSGSSGGSGSSSGSQETDAGGLDGALKPDASLADAAPPVGAGGADAGDPLAAARAQCVQIINQDRATLSPPSPPLTESTKDEACVDQQAQLDFQANTAHSAFGKCAEFAQNECPGWPGPPSSIMTNCLASMWAEGPPPSGQDNHWLNMSNPKYKRVACGFYQTPSGDWWATQDFW